MLSASVHCCSWVQLSVWHLAAAVAVALVSWALRPRRKRHAACVALLGASHSVRCRERSRGSRFFFFQQIDTQCRANLQNAVSKTKQSKLQPLSGAGRFIAQQCPEKRPPARATNFVMHYEARIADAVAALQSEKYCCDHVVGAGRSVVHRALDKSVHALAKAPPEEPTPSLVSSVHDACALLSQRVHGWHVLTAAVRVQVLARELWTARKTGANTACAGRRRSLLNFFTKEQGVRASHELRSRGCVRLLTVRLARHKVLYAVPHAL